MSQNKHFGKTIFRIASFLIILYSLDLTIGNVLRTFYFRQSSGALSRTTYVMEKSEAPGLILGSSRASHHFVSDSLSASLRIPFYNAGKDGQSIFYHYALLKVILKRYTPDIIILDVLHDELDLKQDSYDRLAELLPYYGSHEELHPIIELRGNYERFKMLSNVYPYNSMLLKIGIGNTSLNQKRFVESNGYLPLYGKFKQAKNHDRIETAVPLDPNKVNVLESFIRECKARNVSLFITVSPNENNVRPNTSVAKSKELAAKYDIPFFDFTNDTFFTSQPKYFWDAGHLNDDGANILTRTISKEINVKWSGDDRRSL